MKTLKYKISKRYRITESNGKFCVQVYCGWLIGWDHVITCESLEEARVYRDKYIDRKVVQEGKQTVIE